MLEGIHRFDPFRVSSVEENPRYGPSGRESPTMRINRKNYSLLMDGSLTSLPAPNSLSSKLGEGVLILEYPPVHPPGLGVILLSTHSKEKLFKHLLAKWTVGGYLRKSEKLIGAILVATLPDEINTLILNFVISYKIKYFEDRLVLWHKILQFVPHLPIDPLSYLNAFEPEIFILKKWMDRRRFPAKAYIGIGYSDHGHLSTTLAWQEQQVGEEQVEVPSAEVSLILADFVERASPS